MINQDQIQDWLTRLKRGDILTLARSITLIESQLDSDQERKTQLLQSIQEIRKPSVKIGITGSPGVGKSAFLNTLVSLFRDTSSRIAILTVDPSSTSTGGSILGDKLRMKDLVDMSQVYIRPSPSKGVLGGINLTTWETIQICEAAGFDYVFIETVGVGQSEIEVQYLVNEVWYLTMARSGDEIQGIKKGILEVVNRVIVIKMDLDPNGAQKTKGLLQQILKPMNPHEYKINFYKVSALHPESLESLFLDLQKIPAKPLTKKQRAFWFDRDYQETLISFIKSNPVLKNRHQELSKSVDSGQMDHWTAINELKKELEEKWKK